ncbi:MAG: CDP-alcohol phosphatidyltransferase family protein [bacterium]
MQQVSNEFYLSIIPLIGVNGGFILGYIMFLLLGYGKIRHKDLKGRSESRLILSSLENYWFTITSPCVKLFIKAGITPNIITMFGLSLSIIAGFFFWQGHWGLAGWIMIAGGVFDLFDGRVARATNKVTKAGAYLDSVTDRYSDGFILGGLALAFRDSWALIPTLLCFIGFFGVSYARAKAEASGIKCSVGFFQRPERIFSLGLCAIFSPIVSYYANIQYPILIYFIVTVLGIGTLITSVYRVYYSFKRL